MRNHYEGCIITKIVSLLHFLCYKTVDCITKKHPGTVQVGLNHAREPKEITRLYLPIHAVDFLGQIG